MEIYLPIAEVPINIFVLLILGLFAGISSGLFGIGGGFIMTPMLIFLGISPAVAVASSANQIVASSFSGFLAYAKKRNVDFKIGFILILGGFLGSSIGIYIFNLLKSFGQIDLVISFSYIIILGSIGMLMGIESVKSILGIKNKETKSIDPKDSLFSKLPWQVYFPKSEMEMSILIPIFTSLFIGILVSIMGIGGGFLMIPAMIYIFKMPTNVVIGTSLFQVIFVTANVTILHAVSTHSVDIVLALILLISSVIGAQLGTRLGSKIAAEKLRAMLALIIMVMVIKLVTGFIQTPDNLFEIIG
jgi:uncharacterized protein